MGKDGWGGPIRLITFFLNEVPRLTDSVIQREQNRALAQGLAKVGREEDLIVQDNGAVLCAILAPRIELGTFRV